MKGKIFIKTSHTLLQQLWSQQLQPSSRPFKRFLAPFFIAYSFQILVDKVLIINLLNLYITVKQLCCCGIDWNRTNAFGFSVQRDKPTTPQSQIKNVRVIETRIFIFPIWQEDSNLHSRSFLTKDLYFIFVSSPIRRYQKVSISIHFLKPLFTSTILVSAVDIKYLKPIRVKVTFVCPWLDLNQRLPHYQCGTLTNWVTRTN